MTGAPHPHLCPCWVGHLLASPLRRLVQDAAPIVAPFVAEGMTVLEPGPGLGHFTLELARRVGPTGRVVAVDVQPRMLTGLGRRLRAAGLLGRVELRQAEPDRLGVADLAGQAAFVLAFYLVHEVPDARAFFDEVAATLTADGRLLLPSRDATSRKMRSRPRSRWRGTPGSRWWPGSPCGGAARRRCAAAPDTAGADGRAQKRPRTPTAPRPTQGVTAWAAGARRGAVRIRATPPATATPPAMKPTEESVR
ncbi:MAG TPA: methyltransferase domain-containing protein [Polyangiaceae bacterium]|nr:methyltransferase domain-containing protein [Polyangiaceae bacterium]